MKIRWSSNRKSNYEVGDYIVGLNGLGSSISGCELTDTGQYHLGLKDGEVSQITGITFKDGNASELDPRYYGDNFNLRRKDLRLATTTEIKNFKDENKI